MTTYGRTVKDNKKLAKKAMKKATTADGVIVAVHEDELYLVLLDQGKPIGKISADWACSAVDNFINDLQSQAH